MYVYLFHLFIFIYSFYGSVCLVICSYIFFHVNLIICTFQFCFYLFIYLFIYVFIYVFIYLRLAD